jgi:hypothetical protein
MKRFEHVTKETFKCHCYDTVHKGGRCVKHHDVYERNRNKLVGPLKKGGDSTLEADQIAF